MNHSSQLVLPDYVLLENADDPRVGILRQVAEDFLFPLSKEDQQIIRTVEAKYDAEGNCSGLAAPQLGFSKKMMVFSVPEDDNLKKWRPDISDTMPKTIWLNPSYEPVGTETHTDYEACFSIGEKAGPVARYKTITYRAFLCDGSLVEGTANGFLARVIQHEMDHLYGKLFIDYVPEGELLLIEEYRRRRAEKLGLTA